MDGETLIYIGLALLVVTVGLLIRDQWLTRRGR